MLVNSKDLSQLLIFIGSPIRYFDSSNMLGLHNGSRNAIWCSKKFYCFMIMFECMNSRNGYAIWANALCFKNNMLCFKTLESIIKSIQISLIQTWLTNNITEIQKGCNGLYHLIRYVMTGSPRWLGDRTEVIQKSERSWLQCTKSSVAVHVGAIPALHREMLVSSSPVVV